MIKQIKPNYVREAAASDYCSVTSPQNCVDFWRQTIETQAWFDSEKECVVVLALDHRKKLKGYNLVSIGTCNESYCGPSEVFRPVILSAAKSFVLMHNHPSGDPSPSSADHDVTRRMKQGANIFAIEFTDHVVVGGKDFGEGYFSFREAGLL